VSLASRSIGDAANADTPSLKSVTCAWPSVECSVRPEVIGPCPRAKKAMEPPRRCCCCCCCGWRMFPMGLLHRPIKALTLNTEPSQLPGS